MDDMTIQGTIETAEIGTRRQAKKAAVALKEHIIEIISDSGEGAQKCGQSLGAIAAQMGNGVWTTEIIPAEIRPPARSVAGASGNRIRIGSGYITNGGDETDLVVAFNEQVLLGRCAAKELKPGCIILLESMWRREYRSENRGVLYRDPRPARGRGIQGFRNPDGAECRRRHRRAARQEHVRARHAVPHLQPRAEAGGAIRSFSPSARRTKPSSIRTSSCWKPATSGPKPISTSSYTHPGQAPDRTANRRSTAIPRWRWA
jgi:hypothetical protein